MHDRASKDLDRSVSDYLAVSRGRKHFASEAEYDRAEERSWAVLVDSLAGLGQEQAGPMPSELTDARSRR